MDIKDIIAAGGLVPNRLIRKDIKIEVPQLSPEADWDDPDVPEFTGATEEKTWTIHVRMGTAADEIEMARATDRERPFIAIYRYVCNADGTPLFESLEQAMSLKAWVVIPMFNAIGEVTNTLPKASRRRTSSGSKSPSPSAVAVRKSGNTRSARTGATA